MASMGASVTRTTDYDAPVTDWTSARPAYRQLADALRARMTAGEWSEGDQLPSYAELMREHGVSITVARAAVAALRTEGLVATHQGKGAFVLRRPEAAPDDLLARIEALEARVARLEEP